MNPTPNYLTAGVISPSKDVELTNQQGLWVNDAQMEWKLCECEQKQTAEHVAEECPPHQFLGGKFVLNQVTSDVVDWLNNLTSYKKRRKRPTADKD